MARICLDPGHGLSNRKEGVFDPGAIGMGGAREADWNLTYAECLDNQFKARGYDANWTRRGNEFDCSHADRIRAARDFHADLLVSIHFNADTVVGNSSPDGRVKGFEVLYRTEASQPIAQAVADAMKRAHKKVRGTWVRKDLWVLRFEPSILIEFAFIDDPEDFALIQSEVWKEETCRTVAEAIDGELRKSSTP